MFKTKIKNKMLSLLLIIPILGSVLLIPVSEENENSHSKMKKIALITSLVNFIFSIYIFYKSLNYLLFKLALYFTLKLFKHMSLLSI